MAKAAAAASRRGAEGRKGETVGVEGCKGDGEWRREDEERERRGVELRASSLGLGRKRESDNALEAIVEM